jgi:hypothetical protein
LRLPSWAQDAAWGHGTSFDDAGTVVTKGVGFRYMLASRLGLSMGIDIAKGPEDTAFLPADGQRVALSVDRGPARLRYHPASSAASMSEGP